MVIVRRHISCSYWLRHELLAIDEGASILQFEGGSQLRLRLLILPPIVSGSVFVANNLVKVNHQQWDTLLALFIARQQLLSTSFRSL